MRNNLEHVAWVKSLLERDTVYILGGISRKLTKAFIDNRIAKGCPHTRANKAFLYSRIGAYAIDCNAIFKVFLWEVSPGVINYNVPRDSDLGARALYNNATEKGTMATMPDIPGLMVFTEDKGHVGMYIGKKDGINQYIEATPAWNAWGVTTSADRGHPQGHNRQWATWGKYHLINYIEPPKPVESGDVYTVVRGDVLSRIASRFGFTTADLYELNKDVIGSNPNLIEVGMMLRLKPNVVFVPKYVETVKEVIKEVEVIKTVEVTKPINISTKIDGVSININT